MCSRARETISDVLIYPRESQPRCLTGRDVSVDLEPGLGWELWRCWVWLLLCWTDRNQLGTPSQSHTQPVSPVFTRLGEPTTKLENISNFLFHFYIIYTALYHILGLVRVIIMVMTPVLFPVLMLQHSIAFKSSDELERSYWLARSPGLAAASDWSLSPAGILNQPWAPPALQPGWEREGRDQ